jgi:hypothetical protein
VAPRPTQQGHPVQCLRHSLQVCASRALVAHCSCDGAMRSIRNWFAALQITQLAVVSVPVLLNLPLLPAVLPPIPCLPTCWPQANQPTWFKRSVQPAQARLAALCQRGHEGRPQHGKAAARRGVTRVHATTAASATQGGCRTPASQRFALVRGIAAAGSTRSFAAGWLHLQAHPCSWQPAA